MQKVVHFAVFFVQATKQVENIHPKYYTPDRTFHYFKWNIVKQSGISAAQEGFRVERVFPCRRYCAMEKRMRTVLRNGYIGLNPQTGKLVFVGQFPGFLSLRDQCAHWSWQSPG